MTDNVVGARHIYNLLLLWSFWRLVDILTLVEVIRVMYASLLWPREVSLPRFGVECLALP